MLLLSIDRYVYSKMYVAIGDDDAIEREVLSMKEGDR